MSVHAEYEYNRFLIANSCNEEEYIRVIQAYNTINNNADTYGLIDSSESILSANTYKLIREIISFPEKTIVYDCGCGTAIQQVFFKDCYMYIGIDRLNNFFRICDNARFIHGDILDVVPTMELEPKYRHVAISILCGAIWLDIGKCIKDKFDKVIIPY